MTPPPVSISISGLEFVKRAHEREAILANNHFALGFALKALGGRLEIPLSTFVDYVADDFQITTTRRTTEDMRDVFVVELIPRKVDPPPP